MLLSGSFVKCVASVIAVGITVMLAYWCFVCSLRWQLRHGDIENMYASAKGYRLLLWSVFIVIMYYLACKFLFDTSATVVFLIASVLGLAVTTLLTRRKYGKGGATVTCIYLLLFAPIMCMGTAAVLTWLIPDTVTVCENSDGTYTSTRLYGWKSGEDMDLTKCYLDNMTADTLYRVAVTYAIPGEDLENLYSVTDTFPPMTFNSMKSRADYYMHEIPPLMRWTSGKTGRIRTQRIFVADKSMLSKFIGYYDMAMFGLNPNRRVRALKESSNRVIHEDPENLTLYKRIIREANSRKSH